MTIQQRQKRLEHSLLKFTRLRKYFVKSKKHYKITPKIRCESLKGYMYAAFNDSITSIRKQCKVLSEKYGVSIPSKISDI